MSIGYSASWYAITRTHSESACVIRAGCVTLAARGTRTNARRPTLRHLSQTPTTSAVVVTVASNPRVCVNTASMYSAGSPATASRGTTTW